MISLDKSEIAAIVYLTSIPEFKTFISILQKSLASVSSQNIIVRDEIVLRQNQGKAQELQEIISRIKTSSEDLRAMNSNARKDEKSLYD